MEAKTGMLRSIAVATALIASAAQADTAGCPAERLILEQEGSRITFTAERYAYSGSRAVRPVPHNLRVPGDDLRKQEVWLVKGKIDERTYYLMNKASPYPFGNGEVFYLSAKFPDVPVKLRWRPEASYDDLRAFATDAMQLGGSAKMRAVGVSEKLSGSWSVVGCRGQEEARPTPSSTPAVPTSDPAKQNMIAWFGLPGVTPEAVAITGGFAAGHNAPEPKPDQPPRRVVPPSVVPIVPAQAENVSGTQTSNQADPPTSTDGPRLL
jgi:hypothetical protein